MDEHPLGSGIPGSFEGLLRRLGRQPYYPQWGDDKDRQATSSASRRLFGEDRTEQIFSEIGHESGRTGSAHREPQPYLHARAKAWWKMARRTKGIDPAEVRRLKAHVDEVCGG